MSARRSTRIWAESDGGYAGPLVAAVLSLVAGAALGAVLLALQSVTRVKELPKPSDRARGAVYWVEGSRDAARGRTAPEKVQALLRGQLVTFSEEDLNALLEAAFTAQGKAAANRWVSAGTPNVRVRDGVIQFASELNIEVLGQKLRMVLQTRGTMREGAGGWVFEPSELVLGALPLERVPFAAGWVGSRLLDPRRFHPDLAVAWSRLGRVVVEGNVIKVALR